MTIFDVANWFLCKKPMSHKKVQKLCYYAQAWSYALLGHPLVNDAPFQAWVHGPVCRELYDKYKKTGWKDLQPDTCEFELTDTETDLLESVYLTYGHMSANALEVLSHREPPWQEARLGLDPGQNSENVLSPETMKQYYQSIYIGGD